MIENYTIMMILILKETREAMARYSHLTIVYSPNEMAKLPTYKPCSFSKVR